LLLRGLGDGGFLLTDGKIATTGDRAGNLAFGLSPDEVKLFPEVEANYWVSEELVRWLGMV
jgi:ribosomal protein L5